MAELGIAHVTKAKVTFNDLYKIISLAPDKPLPKITNRRQNVKRYEQ
jgi:hypothetical protein